jgi:hypothetical protein
VSFSMPPRILSEAADAADAEDGADVVAFVKASMAGAALDARRGMPLVSPRVALDHAAEIAAVHL